MMDLKTIAAIAVFAILPASALAQEPQTIVDHINGEGNGAIVVIQPEAMNQRLAAPEVEEVESEEGEDALQKYLSTPRVGGYRIQVFSDNDARTAKNEAQTKARNISSKFPQYRTYVVYNSPYWRLKVGDFRSQEDADEALRELKQAFPVYGKEMRIIRDWITVVE